MSITTKTFSILKRVERDESMMLITIILTYVSIIYLMFALSDIQFTKDCSLSNISPDYTIQEREYCRGILYPKNSSINTTPQINKKVLWI